MEFAFSPEMCAIAVSDQRVYYRLQHIIDEHFPHRIGRKDKIIIFPKEDELHQRRYFLKLVAKLCKKTDANESDLNQLRNSYTKTIKLSLIQTGAMVAHMHIHVRFENNHAIVFELTNNDRLLVSYFKNYFKDHLIQYRMRSRTLTLFPNSDLTCKRVRKLMSAKKHMAWYIHFHYDNDSFERFEKAYKIRFERKRRFSALSGILEDYFKALGCSIDDSFETVRRNYLKLVKEYHPDRQHGKSSDLIAHYRKRFEKIQIAYEMVRTYYQDQVQIA
jgi:molecular chaperone DnaJ